VNPVRYPTPSERLDVIKAVPEDKLGLELAIQRAQLALHMECRPSNQNINALTKWVHAKQKFETAIGLLEGQINNRWHAVEVRK
jgi:hypothetical protein